MKLHLPKGLLTAVLAVVGAWTGLANAETITPAYSGTVYTFKGCTSGNELAFSYLEYTDENGQTATISGVKDAWSDVQTAIATASQGDRNTLKFIEGYTLGGEGIKYTFTPIAVAGFIVDAEGYSILPGSTGGSRNIEIGNTNGTAAYSTINYSFTLNNSNRSDSSIKLHGVQTWDIADSAVFTLNTGSGGITLSAGSNVTQEGGKVDFSSKTLSGAGTYSIGSGTLKNATFASGTTIGLNSGFSLENVTLADGSYVATTAEWATTSGVQAYTKNWDLSKSTGFTVGSGVGFNIEGTKIAASSSYENSTLTISSDVYVIAAADTRSMNDITGVNAIVANGTLSGVSDANLSTSVPVLGSGTVQIGAIDKNNADSLTSKLSALSDFVGTVELMNGAKLHFGNNNTYLSQIDKIKINSGAYITGWGKEFNYDILLNGGNLAVNTGSWTGDIELTADSSIGLYAGTTFSGAITATEGTTLTVKQETVIDTGKTGQTITLNGTVGKLDGATLDIQFGTVKIQGRVDGNALIAGAIKVGAGAKLQVAEGDTLGYKNDNGTLNFTDSITAEGLSKDSLASIQFDASQTMSTDLILKGYTHMTGSEFNSFGGNVTVSGTNNTIENAFKLREDVTFTVNNTTVGDSVVKGSLEMKGNWTDFSGFSGKFVKDGAGEMTISGLITSSRNFRVDNGILNIAGKVNANGEATANTMHTLDLSNGDASTGVVNIKKDAALTVTTLWGCSTSYLTLEEGAMLSIDGVSIVGNAGDNIAMLTSSSNDTYASSKEGFSIANASVTVVNAGEKTLGNTLTGSSNLVKDGEGTLLLSSANTYTGGTTIEKGILALSGNGTLGTGLVTIKKDGTLKTNGSAATMTVTGAGAIDLGNTTALNATLDSTWTGTVKLSGAKLAEADLNDYGNENSTVQLNSSTGSLKAGDVNTKVELKGAPAFKVTETTGKTVTFNNAISGDANFVVEATANTGTDTYVFKGDVSNWKNTNGQVGFIAASDTNVRYEGNATTINHGIYANAGKLDATIGGENAVTVNGDISNSKWNTSAGELNLTVANSSATGVTFNNAVKADSITVNSNSKATFNNQAEATALTVGEKATATFTQGTVKLTNVTLEKDSSMTVSNLTIAEGGSLIFGNGTLLTVTGSLTLDVNSIKLADGFVFANTEAQKLISQTGTDNLNAEAVASWNGGEYVVGGKTYTAGLSMEDGGLYLTLNEVPSKDFVSTSVVETFKVEGVEQYMYTPDGTSLTLNVTAGSLAGLKEGGLVELGLISEGMKQALLQDERLDGDEVTLFLTDGKTTIEAGKDAIVGFYNDDHEGYWGKQVGSNRVYEIDRIPEPTTGALSLIGLAALAMRRRRK